jgi:hypothetical protein
MRAILAMLFQSVALICAASATAAETDWKKVDLRAGLDAVHVAPGG